MNTIPGQYTRGYVYDAFGEVVKAKESYKSGQPKTYYYTYDDGGNITEEVVWDPEAKRDIHNYYEYDPVWKDQLKKYNGKTIDYDKCGNPTQYLDYHMDWDTTNGSLTFVNANGKDCNYTYLSDGQRISKDVGGEKTAYIYNAGMLLYEETKDYRLNFYYDADGLVTEIGYQTKDNGSYSDETRYFYSRNGQGDIIAIYRCKDSTLVGTYEYDLWGNPVSQNENVFTKKVNGKTVTITDEQGILGKNPLRYRGYYFDKETGFYYLNARYYDPVVHRFISADSASNLGAEGEITSYNLYAYCGNDPINRFDYTGQCWEEVWSILNVAIQQSSGELALAGGIALADSPAIGPADAVSALICGAIILTYCIEELNRRRERIKEGTKAIEISISDAKEQKISYWAAELINKEVYLFESLTLEEARLRVSMLGSIMCISQEAAMLILRLNGYRNAVEPEIHGDEGYFYHYHPTRNHTGYFSVHIWYFS
nr:RHS repeat-associated core domain-containing protein [uncultured Butyrivibrio sp.]